MNISGEGFKRDFIFLYFAAISSLAVMSTTGLISGWGEWYSNSIPYRNQTDAFIEGNLAVSTNVSELKFDHTWSEKGVHQVWGLGVPFWRLPFEFSAKLFGFGGFPDRVAFGVFLIIVSFVVFRVWTDIGSGKIGQHRRSFSIRRCVNIGCFALFGLLLFPPFLSLLQTQYAVYEEAVSYGYLFAILQLTGLVYFCKSPTGKLFSLICLLAGFGALIRPTLIFYGASTTLVATVVWVFRNSKSLNARVRLYSVLFGVLLFSIGGGVMWTTNLLRFGNGFEFGHKLNVQDLFGSMYATRFDYPFQDVPINEASQELCGALFFGKKLNYSDFYAERVFLGQSDSLRWRGFYFRTFDWTYIPFLLLGWLVTICLLTSMVFFQPQHKLPGKANFNAPFWDLKSLRKTSLRNSLYSFFRSKRDGVFQIVSCGDQFTILILGSWSLVSTILLFSFYLYVPVISSRYVVDFAPAFAACIGVTWFLLANVSWGKVANALACSAFVGWTCAQIYLGRGENIAPNSVTWSELTTIRRLKLQETPPVKLHPVKFLGDGAAGTPFDRVGWNPVTGELKPLVILFLEDIEFLELELGVQNHPTIAANPYNFRAKIGLEHLELDRITRTNDHWIVRFRGPHDARWVSGVQTAFLATVQEELLAEQSTPWILKSVKWKNN